MAKENLRDRFGHQIYPGECYLRRFYLQESRSKKMGIIMFSVLKYDVYLTPDEIFEPFAEISNDLTINSDESLKLLEIM